jgi:hypothetical protein
MRPKANLIFPRVKFRPAVEVGFAVREIGGGPRHA